MATMSHTPAQRKAWHAGRLEVAGGESTATALRRWYRAGHVTQTSAYTPSFLKRGLTYGTPIDLPRNRGGGQR